MIVSACSAGAGIAMIAGGAINLCSQLISDRIGRVGAGIASIVAGVVSLAGGFTGIPAVVMGILGVSSIALGVNEIITGITGENYMQTLTGMSDEMYGAIFAGVTIATALGNAFFAQCFAEGTLVKTEEGDKKIEEIEVGDKVLAYDEDTGKQEYKQVTRLFRNVSSTKTTLQIRAEDGTVDEIISTPGHKYYLPDNTVNRNPNEVFEHASYECLGIKWVSACYVKPKDKVLISKGKYGIVVSVKTEDCDLWTTYNFEVEGLHTYYVGENGVCVHNTGCETPINELNHTNGKNLKNSDFNQLKADIQANEIQDIVKITEINGSKYIVDGNHRVAIARQLGMKTVPAEMVGLPYKGFATVTDVINGNTEYLIWRSMGGRW